MSGYSGVSGYSGYEGTSGYSGFSGAVDPTYLDNLAGKVGENYTDDNPPVYDSEVFISGDHNTALGELDSVLAAIAPAQPGVLTGQNLTLSIISYSARLSSGLAPAWYTGGDSPGDLITGYIVTPAYLLATPSPATLFRAGRAGIPSTYGTLTHILNGAAEDTYDCSLGPGTSGTVTLDSLAAYNSIWEKANAHLAYTSGEGRVTHALNHNLALTSNATELFYDDLHTAPAFAVTPTVLEDLVIDKYLSGIKYYGHNTSLLVSYTGALGIFQKCYHPTQVSLITCVGAPNLAVNPSVVPAYNAQFVVVNQKITLSIANQASMSKILGVGLYKPEGTFTSAVGVLARAICTYGIASTTVADYFYDEDKRVVLDTLTPWNSTVLLANGDAQVRNGSLEYGDTDYPTKAGDQEYQRHIYKVSASTGTLTFVGIAYNEISPYGTGDLNMFIQLDSDGQFYDLGRVVGDNNGDGSGDSRANSKGARVSGSGSVLNWSIGTYTTGDNNNRYRVAVVFRTSAKKINSVVGS